MINIFKMFTIGPRYSFGCPAVFTLAYCSVLRCSAVFRHTASISIIRMMKRKYAIGLPLCKHNVVYLPFYGQSMFV